MEGFATVYKVRRAPITAGAKMSAGYSPVNFEYVAENAKDAVRKCVAECEWQRPTHNFAFRVIESRVISVASGD